MIVNNTFAEMLNKPVRELRGRVEIYNGSTLTKMCGCHDALKSFTIERIGDSKFYGYGICQKMNVKLIDTKREIDVSTANYLEAVFGVGNDYIYAFPKFDVSEVRRDENTNELSITAYDALYGANKHTFSELNMNAPYTIKDVAEACAGVLRLPLNAGKNVWDNNNYITGISNEYLVKTETGFIFTRGSLTGGKEVSIKQTVRQGETYTFSYDKKANEAGQLYIYKDAIYGTVLANTANNSLTYTFNEDMVVYFTIIINSTVSSLTASNIQVERNNRRSNYEPYLTAFDIKYPVGANFEGTETLRSVLDAIAGATQTIYYINNNWELTFKRLDIDGDAIFTLDRDKYFTLDSGDNRRLVKVVSATELGDNVSAGLSISGTTHYERDNPFWDLRDDIDTLVENALSAVGGLTINQFNASWRGNFLLEIGDKLSLVRKDGTTENTYLLHDTINFDGSLTEETEWEYEVDEADSAENPSSLGEALKQTFARVDKANKQITLLVSDIEANKGAISSLILDTDNIRAEVSQTQKITEDGLNSLNDNLNTLTSKVNATMSAQDVKLEIQKELANGTDKVITSTGFTFDESGLSVSKTGSEMTTTITEDGMTVYKDNEEVLTANNKGVKAIDLHATTYLIIGTNSRLEDFGDRTGCFWIGG